MATGGGGRSTQGGEGFARPSAEMLKRPAPLEGEARVIAEQQARDAEMKRLDAEARGAAAADALLNPPLKSDTPIGKMATGAPMADVAARLEDVPVVSIPKTQTVEDVPLPEAPAETSVQAEPLSVPVKTVIPENQNPVIAEETPDVQSNVSSTVPVAEIPVAPVPPTAPEAANPAVPEQSETQPPATSVPEQAPAPEAGAAQPPSGEGSKEAAPEERNITPPTAEVTPAQATIETPDEILKKNQEYQQESAVFDKDVANKRWKDIDALPQEQKDKELEHLKGADKKAYEQYVETRERLAITRAEAEWSVREKQLDSLEAEIKTLFGGAERTHKENQLREGRQKLEDERRDTHEKSILAKSARYQELQRKNRATEQRLMEEFKYTEDDLHNIAGKKWEDVQRDSILSRVFPDEKAFKTYKADRGEMNGEESSAHSKVESKRMSQNYNPDGTRMTGTPAEIEKQKRQQLTDYQEKAKYKGPGVVRKWLRKRTEGLEDIFGRKSMEDHRGKAFSYARRLITDNGFWKGLVVPIRFLPKDQQAQAKILRNLMWKEVGSWAGRSVARKLLLFSLFQVALILALPVIYGKALEMTKPFGGGQ